MPEAEPVEFTPPVAKSSNPKEHRSWGSDELLSSGSGFQVRRLTLKPLERLPLQWHRHRDKHWAVARGTARVMVDGKELTLGRGQAFDIPRTVPHRIGNISSIDPLDIIELQTGDYLGDDDVVLIDEDSVRGGNSPDSI